MQNQGRAIFYVFNQTLNVSVDAQIIIEQTAEFILLASAKIETGLRQYSHL